MTKSASIRYKSSNRANATMSDVARLAGVSPMSVSNCYNQPAKVSAETRAKILEAAAQIGYVPNLLLGARALGVSRIVGAVIPSLQNIKCASMIKGINEILVKHGYQLMVSLAGTPKQEYSAIQAFIGRRVDGVILTGVEQCEQVFHLLRRTGVPAVQTWSLDGPFIDMSVGFSLSKAAFDLTQLMIDRGYRYIGFAGHNMQDDQHSSEYLDGFRFAMQMSNLQDDLIYFGSSKTVFADAWLAIDNLLQRESRLQALLCETDALAAGVIFECARREWSIPGRFAVAGCGDSDIAADTRPSLTTVRTSGHDIGSAAAKILLNKIEGHPTEKKIIDIGYNIDIRDSI